jgi:hypothetical protein
VVVLALNSGSHTSQAGTLALEPLHQPCFVLGVFKVGFHELFSGTGFES